MCKMILLLFTILEGRKKKEYKSTDNRTEVSGTHMRRKHKEHKQREESKIGRKYTNHCFSPKNCVCPTDTDFSKLTLNMHHHNGLV